MYSSSRSFLFLFFLLFFSVKTTAQDTNLSLQTTIPNARYQIDEKIQIEVSGESGIATYRIFQDQYTPILQTAEIQLQNGKGIIEFQHSKVALLICEVEQNNKKASVGIAIEPFEIAALEEEPEDFDEFWAETKEELQNIPIDAKISFHAADNYSNTYRINLANINNRRVYGYISIPKGNGPFPAMLILPPYGLTPNLVSPKQNICRDIGVIALSLSIHNVEPDERDPNAYMPNDISDPYQNYYRQAVTGALQSINYLYSRSDFSGDLIVSGVSQGAGLALMTASLEERVKFLTFSGVTHAQHQGRKYGEASGFPYYLHQVRNFPLSMRTATSAAAQYYESIYFARRYRGKALIALGYLDNVTHAATQLAVFNALKGEKVLIHSKEAAHTHPSEFWRLRYEMTLQNFPFAKEFAWQFSTTNTGYAIDAGKDTTIAIEDQLSLNANILFNEQALIATEIEWEVVESVGEIEWENPNSLNPTLRFVAAGTYVLKLRVHDYQDLVEKNTYYTLEDEIRVEVEIREVESQLSVTCPENIEVAFPTRAEQGVVEWEVPEVTSICELGVANLIQISGANSGDELSIGTHTIEYLATNPCGDSASCQLTINIFYTEAEGTAYCSNRGEQPWQEWIQEVQLHDLRLFSQKEGYGDFVNYTTQLNPATTYEMSVQIGYSYMDTVEHIAAYIDFNQDSIFQDSERIFQTAFTAPSFRAGVRTFQTTVAIPPDVKIGATRMRVLLSRVKEAKPCTTIAFGEVEDYSILFVKEKADTTGITANKNIFSNEIQLFPNPVNDRLNLSFESSGNVIAKLQVLDIWGRLVEEREVKIRTGQNQQEIATSHWANGFYFLQLWTVGEMMVSQKIVKTN